MDPAEGVEGVRAFEDMFAHETPAGLRDFMPSTKAMSLCGTAPIVRVRVTVTEDGPLWAWWDAKQDVIRNVFGSRTLLETCFTYGSKAEEERGRGKVIRARANVLGPLNRSTKETDMNEEDVELIKAGTAALTEALGAEKAAAFLALVNPGEARGAIEPPPTAPAKGIFEHGVRDAARQVASVSGLSFVAADRVGDAALAAYRKELA